MKPVILTMICLALSGCESSIQDTSGQAYLEARNGKPVTAIDAEIQKIAAVEPDLRFPARIGVARIVNRQLTLASSEEMAMFGEIVKKNRRYGEFISVSPLVYDMVNPDQFKRSVSIVNQIRKAAARQHIDYVVIYELGAHSQTGKTPFALADVTLIGGMILPTRSIKVAGVGSAAIVDVRNGYPYGMTNTVVELSGLSRSFGYAYRKEEELENKATLKVAKNLIPKIENLMLKLWDNQKK